MARADYFLDEARSWALRPRELRRAHARAGRRHAVRALVVINPGNPTGQVTHLWIPYTKLLVPWPESTDLEAITVDTSFVLPVVSHAQITNTFPGANPRGHGRDNKVCLRTALVPDR